MKLKLSKYALIIPIPAYRDKPNADQLLFSTRTGKTIRISSYFLGLLQEGAYTQLPDKLTAILLNNEILVPEDEDETEAVVSRNLIRSLDESTQSVTVLLPAPEMPAPHFYTSLRNTIDAALFAMPASSIKGFKYTVRLLLILQHSADWDWLEELDRKLEEWRPLLRAQFILQVLAINEGCNGLQIPRLQSTMQNKLYFVFDRLEQGMAVTNAVNAIQALYRQLQDADTIPCQVHAVLLATASCWQNWGNELPATLRELSAHRNVTLEFLADDDEADLRKFTAGHQIRGSWVPRPQHRCYAFQPSRHTLSVEGFHILHEDISWDAEDIRCMLTHQSLPAGKFYYDDNYAGQLIRAEHPCRDCLYLPLCGGNAGKKAVGLKDCPVFVRQLSHRVMAAAGLELH
jgi:hypothetical protein